MMNNSRLKVFKEILALGLLIGSSLMAVSCDKKQEMQKAQTIEDVPVMQSENEIPDSLKRIGSSVKDSASLTDTTRKWTA